MFRFLSTILAVAAVAFASLAAPAPVLAGNRCNIGAQAFVVAVNHGHVNQVAFVANTAVVSPVVAVNVGHGNFAAVQVNGFGVNQFNAFGFNAFNQNQVVVVNARGRNRFRGANVVVVQARRGCH